MTKDLRTAALLLVVVGAAGSWHPARATDFRCSSGGQERRIELGGPDAARGRACEVRYWRDARAADSGRVLWYAEQNTEYCVARALELVARLEAGGWTCEADEQAAIPEPADSASAAPPEAAAASPPSPPALAAPEPAPRAFETGDVGPPAPPEAPEPAATAAVERSLAPPAPTEPAAAVTAEPSRPAPAPQEPAAAVTAERSPPDVAPLAASPPEAPVVPHSAHPAAALLDRVVQETLRSVEQLYGGEFQADHAAFGDLDGDGLEDAAVLITYEAAKDDYVQYLVAYRFDGASFQSVATKNVGGRFLDAAHAALEGIADRRILVELEALKGGADCCATRRAAFALQGGHLVEVTDAPEGDEASQAERSSPG